MPRPRVSELRIACPGWVDGVVDWTRAYDTDAERMHLVISLARENIERETGGPFAAAVFEQQSGMLVSVGLNSVTRLDNCILHGEIMALMMAQARLGTWTLGAPEQPVHELVSSCAPCAMCLGATLWSGVKRLVCGALREDALACGFEEGPVFPESHAYLRARGVELVFGVDRDAAVEVLHRYRELGGPVYNG